MNAGLKLALNGTYGKTNDVFSPFYDPQYMLTITINGQLLLTMLGERIIDVIEDSTMLQANTDGLTIKILRDDYFKLLEICSEWEEFTSLTLEYAEYKQMVIRDVNNYLAEYTNGDVKLKGCFEYDKPWHKNHSMKIVAKALEKYFVEGIPVEETIDNTTDIHDFFICFKAAKGYTMKERFYDEISKGIGERKIQKTNRYLVTLHGSKLLKSIVKWNDKKGRDELKETYLQADYLCTIYNEYDPELSIESYNINKDFYVKECNKIIDVVCNSELQLSLF